VCACFSEYVCVRACEVLNNCGSDLYLSQMHILYVLCFAPPRLPLNRANIRLKGLFEILFFVSLPRQENLLPWVTAGYLFGSITLESIFLFFPIFVMIHDDVSYQ